MHAHAVAILLAACTWLPWTVAQAQAVPTNPSGTTAPTTGIPQIDRFYVSPNNTLRPGTRLKFAIKGTPGGQAFLTIPGETDPMPMKEVRAGLYERTYTIRPDDRLRRDVNIRADLKQGENVTTATLKIGQQAVTPSQGVVR